jgi:hypothetical protein
MSDELHTGDVTVQLTDMTIIFGASSTTGVADLDKAVEMATANLFAELVVPLRKRIELTTSGPRLSRISTEMSADMHHHVLVKDTPVTVDMTVIVQLEDPLYLPTKWFQEMVKSYLCAISTSLHRGVPVALLASNAS